MLEEMSKEESEEIIENLKKHPRILKRMGVLLGVIDESGMTADDVEEALIPEVRGLGQDMLRDWGIKEEEISSKEAKKSHLRHHSKKK